MSSDSRHKSKFDGRIGLLKILAKVLNPTKSGEISLTLNVHGKIISGVMIGMNRYYELIGKMFLDAIKSGSPQEVSHIKEELKHHFDKIKVSPIETQIEEEVEYNHIFMRYVKIYDGKRVYSPPYWIGKIESVDGFFLGRIDELQT